MTVQCREPRISIRTPRARSQNGGEQMWGSRAERQTAALAPEEQAQKGSQRRSKRFQVHQKGSDMCNVDTKWFKQVQQGAVQMETADIHIYIYIYIH